MANVTARYTFSIQSERFYKTVRYHWTIYAEQSPDRIVSWGHAASKELAETAAQHEIKDLSSGFSHGGRVENKRKVAIRF